MKAPTGISVKKNYEVLIEKYHWMFGAGRSTVYVNGKQLKRLFEDNITVIKFNEHSTNL